MNKLIFTAACAVASLFSGCTTAHIKTGEWEATINSHWLKRDVDKLSITRGADGSYTVNLNGYKSDTSEQLPAFTREMWNGLAVIGRLAMGAPAPVAAATNAADCADGSCEHPAVAE